MTDGSGAARPSRAELAGATVSAVLSGEIPLTGLDELVQAAAVATWAPIALISMITDRQVTASARRTRGDGPVPERGAHVSLEDSVCVHALHTDGPVRIADARRDERVAHIPAVLDGRCGSYLGVPLRAEAGDLVGVLCVYDVAPRSWSETEERDLDEVARQVSAELRRIVTEHAAARVSPDATAPDPR